MEGLGLASRQNSTLSKVHILNCILEVLHILVINPNTSNVMTENVKKSLETLKFSPDIMFHYYTAGSGVVSTNLYVDVVSPMT